MAMSEERLSCGVCFETMLSSSGMEMWEGWGGRVVAEGTEKADAQGMVEYFCLRLKG